MTQLTFLETIDYGISGWQAILARNAELLDYRAESLYTSFSPAGAVSQADTPTGSAGTLTDSTGAAGLANSVEKVDNSAVFVDSTGGTSSANILSSVNQIKRDNNFATIATRVLQIRLDTALANKNFAELVDEWNKERADRTEINARENLMLANLREMGVIGI